MERVWVIFPVASEKDRYQGDKQVTKNGRPVFGKVVKKLSLCPICDKRPALIHLAGYWLCFKCANVRRGIKAA